MNYIDAPFFYNTALLFSDNDMKIIDKSCVAIAGMGGIGSITAEMLVRLGIGNLKIADPDIYAEINLNRQLFATNETIGINKAIAAAERLKKINPNVNIEIYEKGINLSNVESFCRNADTVAALTDTESSKILMHRTSKKHNIPVIAGSRSSLYESRWKVKATVWNYKKKPDLNCYDEINHPEFALIPNENLTEDLLKKYDQKIQLKKKNVFSELAVNNSDMFKSISQENLLKRIETIENFQNRHVCSVIANTAGCITATTILKLLLNGDAKDLELNLWE